MTTKRNTWIGLSCLVLVGGSIWLALAGYHKGFGQAPDAGSADFKLEDEAQAAGKTVDDFPEEDKPIWKYMDGDTPDTPGEFKLLKLTSDEEKGRNTWLMWCGGNEAFWDWFANHSLGLSDFLKVLDSRDRGKRFERYGLMSEPGFKKADKPDKYGVWLDERTEPLEESREDVYGLPSGIVGLRLFKNPNFFNSKAAQDAWDGEKYYKDRHYYQNPNLIRPYRVGMACAFCHVGPHPLYPPADKEAPKWENLSSNIGAQYFKVRPIFGPMLDRDSSQTDSFMFQLLESSRPGTLDTSLIPTDNLNNPNTMNAIFHVGARLARSQVTPPEKQGGPALSVKADHDALGLPADSPDGMRHIPHVLVDGSDSVGISAALNRVYINIGTFHQYWIQTQNPLVGGRPQIPFEIANARKGSVYWRVTEKRTVNLAKFFLKEAKPMPLAKAPGGAAYLKKADDPIIARGKIAFATNCISCHSSKQPDDGVERLPKDHATWSKDPAYLKWAVKEVQKDDFLDGNYLSVDQRYGVDVIQTNACRAAGTNATKGHVWDNFSSDTYKSLPPVTIKVHDPVDDKEKDFTIRGSGPGYYRVPTLVSIWATAPYFHNNALGKYNDDPSVKGRMECYDDGIRKLLWPEKRDNLKSIWRTDHKSYLILSTADLPEIVEGVTNRKWVTLMYPWLVPLILLVVGAILFFVGSQKMMKGVKVLGGLLVVLAVAGFVIAVIVYKDYQDLRIGPIPKGTPINLLANIDTSLDKKDVIDAIIKTKLALAAIEHEQDETKALDRFMKDAGSALLKVSKCPDLVEDRGHYFGKDLSDEDKEALIEYLKMF